MRAGQRVSLVLAVSMLGAWQAGAQTLPRPGEEAPAPDATAPSITPMEGAPLEAAPMPPDIGCMIEINKLREDVQKRVLAIKTAFERKLSVEEMCKHARDDSAAELKLIEHVGAIVATCGLPVKIMQDFKQMHANTEQYETKFCMQGRFLLFPGPKN
jgi:hypothetical protein